MVEPQAESVVSCLGFKVAEPDPAFQELLPPKQGGKMAFSARQLILFGLVVTAFYLTSGSPTREFAGEKEESDLADATDEQESGVLGRLWSSLSTLTGLKRRDTGDRLDRFRRDLLTSWHHSIKTLTHASRRHRRDLENGLTTDTEGYWLLTNLDSNVLPRLMSFSVPAGLNSMTIFEHEAKLFWIGTHGTGIAVYYVDMNTDMFEQVTIPSKGASKCVPVMKTQGFIEMVCAESLDDGDKVGSGAYTITWSNGLEVKLARTLPTQAAKDVAYW
ncbi:uncharacterized protein LOC125031030 [Penaeus chinensis]|uniref:uncharacterized protein LOC125031030 n=1 Tax=Penaeus chinensis TaxID=139456 RepID=UPI001FB80237|nr:uncharacterized protein LOC125031030 [Penaeus chinensis]